MQGNGKERKVGVDFLKLLATIFVIVLHVDGYMVQGNGTAVNSNFEFGYILLETLAYPAIHIFVLCGAFLMSQERIPIKQYVYIYATTLAITLIGFIVAFFVMRSSINPVSVMNCILPFSFRAYGYVSTYLILMLLSPFLDKLTAHLNNMQFRRLLFISIIPVGIMPTVLEGVWESSYLGLFIWLYFVAGYAKKFPERFFRTGRGLAVWGGYAAALILSFYLFKRVSIFNLLNRGDQLYFYHYNSFFVIGMAIGLFMAIGNLNVKPRKFLSVLSGFSLVIYEFHMHPIIKTQYAEWLPRIIRAGSNREYLFSVFLLVLVVFITGSCAAFLLIRPIKSAAIAIEQAIAKTLRTGKSDCHNL